MTLITGGNNPAQAVLMAYLIAAFLNPDVAYMRSRADPFSLCFLMLVIASFIAYFTYQWSFGYAAERMVWSIWVMRWCLCRLGVYGCVPSNHFWDRISLFRSHRPLHWCTDKYVGIRCNRDVEFQRSGLRGCSDTCGSCRIRSNSSVFHGDYAANVYRLAYGWKLSLVVLALVPVLVIASYLIFHLQYHLQDHLSESSLKSAALTCELVGSIRTIAALRREEGIYREYCASIETSTRMAMLSTLKATLILSSL